MKMEQINEIKRKYKDSIIQFLKFGIVGGINTNVSYAITNIGFYVFNLHPQICNAVAFAITVFISFILNSQFVFTQSKEEKPPFLRALFKVYVSYSITGLFLMGILLYIEESIFGIPHYIATLANLIVTIPINFILNKFWAYKNK